jgi:hypothetical protein
MADLKFLGYSVPTQKTPRQADPSVDALLINVIKPSNNAPFQIIPLEPQDGSTIIFDLQDGNDNTRLSLQANGQLNVSRTWNSNSVDYSYSTALNLEPPGVPAFGADGSVQIIVGTGTADPTATGVPATPGSLIIDVGGALWIKGPGGDTDWSTVGGGTLQASYDLGPDITLDATGGIQITRPAGTSEAYALRIRNTGTDLGGGNAALLVEQVAGSGGGVAAKFVQTFAGQGIAVQVTDTIGAQTLDIAKDQIRSNGFITISPYGADVDALGSDLTLTGGGGGTGTVGPGQSGGIVFITGGTGGAGGATALGGGDGGDIAITGGIGGSPFDGDGPRGSGGNVAISGGTAGFSASPSGSAPGGDVSLIGGDGGGDGGVGGSIYLVPGTAISNGGIYLGTTVEADFIESGLASVAWTHRGSFWAHEEVRVGNFSLDGSAGSFIRLYSVSPAPSSLGAEQGALYALLDDASGPDLYYRQGTSEGAGVIWQITGGESLPADVGSAADNGGLAELARVDHVHAHGTHTEPTNHAVATSGAHGFMSSTDKAKLDLVVSGTYTPSFTPTEPANTVVSAVGDWIYQRVGTVIHVHGTIDLDTTGITVFPYQSISVTLPVTCGASGTSFLAGGYIAPYGGASGSANLQGPVLGVAAAAPNAAANISFLADSAGSKTVTVWFMYRTDG